MEKRRLKRAFRLWLAFLVSEGLISLVYETPFFILLFSPLAYPVGLISFICGNITGDYVMFQAFFTPQVIVCVLLDKLLDVIMLLLLSSLARENCKNRNFKYIVCTIHSVSFVIPILVYVYLFISVSLGEFRVAVLPCLLAFIAGCELLFCSKRFSSAAGKIKDKIKYSQ